MTCCLSSTRTYPASAFRHSKRHTRSDIFPSIFIRWEAPHMLSESLPLHASCAGRSWESADVTHIKRVTARTFFIVMPYYCAQKGKEPHTTSELIGGCSIAGCCISDLKCSNLRCCNLQ